MREMVPLGKSLFPHLHMGISSEVLRDWGVSPKISSITRSCELGIINMIQSFNVFIEIEFKYSVGRVNVCYKGGARIGSGKLSIKCHFYLVYTGVQ